MREARGRAGGTEPGPVVAVGTGSRALGVDVGVAKGLDAVLLDRSLVPVAVASGIRPRDLAPVIEDLRPDVVAIDSPPGWGASGASRACERRLLALGIHSYATPSDPRRGAGGFYDWMRCGFEAFAAARRAGFPLFRRGRSVRGRALEVFPHASATVLAGALPPPGAGKRSWREDVLRRAGVAVEALATMDQVDAALAALTGQLALAGQFRAVGDPREGVIVVPVGRLPDRPYRPVGSERGGRRGGWRTPVPAS